jgi:predicted nucleic acid-binding protein
MYCFDTDILSAAMRRDPALHLIRRLARVPSEQQYTTAITLAELLYGAARRGGSAGHALATRVRDIVESAQTVLAFDEAAAEVYGPLRARLEAAGTPLAEPDLRIAAIVLARDLTLVTGNLRHFTRVPGLRVESWLSET